MWIVVYLLVLTTLLMTLRALDFEIKLKHVLCIGFVLGGLVFFPHQTLLYAAMCIFALFLVA